MKGARIVAVDQRRPDLRFPFPERFGERLEGATVLDVGRRAKFLVMPLDTGETLLGHLGMTGRFSVKGQRQSLEPGAFYAPNPPQGHEHLALTLRRPDGQEVSVTYSDPRRFGFFELEDTAALATLPRMAKLGPEPLGEGFTAQTLIDKVKGRSMPIKSALLDQSNVAGLGNIYVCEALFRAGLSPRRKAGTLGPKRASRLVAEIKAVLDEAIEAGGSTLRDYASAQGHKGAFQQRFFVYDREGADCSRCGTKVVRYVQSGRSTFACTQCQR